MLHIMLFGPPGAGKGVQSQLLTRRYQLKHIAPGNIFREEIKKCTPLGGFLKNFLDNGDLVPEDLVLETVKQALEDARQSTQYQGVLFDGYPRSLEQAQALNEYLAFHQHQLHLVFCLHVDNEEIMRRLAIRSKVEGRTDDVEAKIVHRLRLYETYSKPVLDYYQQETIHIDGARTIEEINRHIEEEIAHCLVHTSFS